MIALRLVLVAAREIRFPPAQRVVSAALILYAVAVSIVFMVMLQSELEHSLLVGIRDNIAGWSNAPHLGRTFLCARIQLR